MTVPRENRLVRFYIHLKGTLGKEAIGLSKPSPDGLVEMAERIMKPYKLAFKHCDWWSLYHVRAYMSVLQHPANKEEGKTALGQTLQTP